MPASNATFLGDIAGVQVVYKPVSGERPLWDFPHGTLADRERAAYLLSQATGWDVVPETWLRDGPHGVGMVQRWQEPDPEQVAVTLVAEGQVPQGWRHVFDGLDGQDQPISLIHEDGEALRRMAVFDVLANNADRKGGHVLEMSDGHRYGVDHGVAFHAEHKLRTVLWGWSGRGAHGGGAGRGRAGAHGRRRSAGRRRWPPTSPTSRSTRSSAAASGWPSAPCCPRPAGSGRPSRGRRSDGQSLGFAACEPGLPRRSRTCPWRGPRWPSTTRRPAVWSPRRRTEPRACTSAASRRTTRRTWVTRTPTSPSTCSTGPGATPATRSPTSRTSPTSTTRSWSGPRRSTSTGSSWPSARPSSSVRT